MKFLSITLLAMTMFAGLAVTGCETSRTETHKEGILGGSTDTSTVTKENPVTGDTSTTHKETKTP